MSEEKRRPYGRPPKWETHEELEHAIERYFKDCIEYQPSEEDESIMEFVRYKRPLTMTGLANYLAVDRKTLINYSKDEKFFHTIKEARNMVEQFAEEQLFEGKGNVAGVIFNMINNFGGADGWKNKSEVKNDTSITWHEQKTYDKPEEDGTEK